MSRSMGSSSGGRRSIWATPTRIPVERNERCAPELNTSAGRQSRITRAARASELTVAGRRPAATAPQATHTRIVARITGVPPPTSSM